MNLKEKYIAYLLSTSDSDTILVSTINGVVVPRFDELRELERFIMHEEHLTYKQVVTPIVETLNNTSYPADKHTVIYVDSSGEISDSVSLTKTTEMEFLSMLNLATHGTSVIKYVHSKLSQEVIVTLHKPKTVSELLVAQIGFLLFNKGYTHLSLMINAEQTEFTITDLATNTVLGIVPVLADAYFETVNYSLELVTGDYYSLNGVCEHDILPIHDFEFKYIPRMREII